MTDYKAWVYGIAASAFAVWLMYLASEYGAAKMGG